MKKLTESTISTKASEITRSWYEVDIKDAILGRVATQIALHLMGKNKAYFVRSLDCGDYVVVTNASAVKVSGRKPKNKTYTNYSGYPGGLRKEVFEDMRKRKPDEIIVRAVTGMLPKNKLRDQMLKRLYVYPGSAHPYKKQILNSKF